MAVEIKVSTKGLVEGLKRLKAAEIKLRDVKPVLTVTAEKIKSLTDESFASSQSPDGTAWAPLKPTTLKRKLANGYSSKPLIRRGARGLQGATHATAKKDRILVGVSPTAPHGAYHQQGTEWIPRRPFLPFTPSGDLMRSPKVKAILADMEERLRAYLFGE